MGYGDHCISSHRYCFPTEDYNEWNEQTLS